MIDDCFWHCCFGHQEIVNFFFHLKDVQGTKNKDTLRETNMEPENTPLEKEKHLPNTYFGFKRLVYLDVRLEVRIKCSAS